MLFVLQDGGIWWVGAGGAMLCQGDLVDLEVAASARRFLARRSSHRIGAAQPRRTPNMIFVAKLGLSDERR
jgi:hypothetical protein